jgi:hypothetical protein
MFKRVLFGGLFVLSATAAISATVVAASSLTERLESQRMTVLKTDLALQAGDIVRVEPQAGGRAHLVLLRSAADELESPEK